MLTGRPTDYTEALADEICKAIANSPRGLNHHSKENDHWPHSSTIRRWLRENDSFRDKYAQAKEDQADLMAEETVDVAYNDKKDWKVIIDDDGNEKTVFVSEAVARSRLKVDALKWHASKLAPKKYGERIETNHGVSQGSFMETILDRISK
jgi:hypothetical protein